MFTNDSDIKVYKVREILTELDSYCLITTINKNKFILHEDFRDVYDQHIDYLVQKKHSRRKLNNTLKNILYLSFGILLFGVAVFPSIKDNTISGLLGAIGTSILTVWFFILLLDKLEFFD